MKVLITSDLPGNAVEILLKNGIEVIVYDKKKAITKAEFIKLSKDVDGVLSLFNDKVDKDIIVAMEKCKVIANYAVGYNNIDVEYANKKGIIVTNTPDAVTDSTADIAMTLVLACARRVPECEKFMRADKFHTWGPKTLLGYELRNKNFGIIGAGRIGAAVAERAKAFGCNILYYSNHKNEELEKKTGAKKLPLKTLLKASDIVSLHVPLTPKTEYMINEEMLGLLKNTAIFINTARGNVVDEKALIKILREKKIFMAGFDVYENEPNINKDILKLDNVVLCPHIGSATVESRNAMAKLAAENLVAVLKGRAPITPVILSKKKK